MNALSVLGLYPLTVAEHFGSLRDLRHEGVDFFQPFFFTFVVLAVVTKIEPVAKVEFVAHEANGLWGHSSVTH